MGKLMDLAQAVGGVPDGALLGLGGNTLNRAPMAAVMELARQGKRGLRLVTLVGHRGTPPTTGLSWSSAEYSTLRLRELAPWAADADVFICGPLRWTEDAQAEAIACGVPQTQIHAERFAQ